MNASKIKQSTQSEEKKVNILIVDDNSANLLALQDTLDPLNENIIWANSGRDALKMLLEYEFSVILLDVQMPDIDGFEVANIVRKRKQSQDIPIIFLSAHFQENIKILEGYSLGAVDYILKPYSAEIVKSKVSVFVEMYKMKREIIQQKEREIILTNTALEISQQNEKNNEGTINVLLDALSEAAILINNNGLILVVNSLASQFFDVSMDKIVNMSLFDLSPERKNQVALAITSQKMKSFECKLANKIYAIAIYPIQNKGGSIDRLAIFINDITEESKQQEQLMQLANYDSVTGLHNRSFFISHQNIELENAVRFNRRIAVLFIDLDNFKEVNDTLGHDAGDTLLKLISERLLSSVRDSDLVARIGGDEFAILLTEMSNNSDAGFIAKKILTSLNLPYLINEQTISTTASIGIACYPECGKNYSEMNIAADTAMYKAKKEGKNSFRFFTAKLQQESEDRAYIINNLRNALVNNEISVAYQPKICTTKNIICGVESLLRWTHPTLGVVSPGIFIPIAEEIGLIDVLGKWVLHQTCKDYKEMIDSLPSQTQLIFTTAVNVSVIQLKQSNFTSLLKTTLKETNFPADKLQIELTESALMKDFDNTTVLLNGLREMGISIAIDDFGTGYSSLSYLNRLPVDTIKIDLSFVQQIGESKESESIIKSIIALAKALDFKTVAEGVEKKEQTDFLTHYGCDYLQGYFYGKPVSKDVLLKQLKMNKVY